MADLRGDAKNAIGTIVYIIIAVVIIGVVIGAGGLVGNSFSNAISAQNPSLAANINNFFSGLVSSTGTLQPLLVVVAIVTAVVLVITVLMHALQRTEGGA